MALPPLGDKAWDELFVGGFKFPGLWTISGPGIERKIDTKKPKGKAKASLTDEGDELGRIDCRGMLHTDEQLAEFVALLPMIHPRRVGGPKSPTDFYHPLANLLGIKQIYVNKIPIPKIERGGKLFVSFSVLEWVPKPKPQRRGVGGTGGGGNRPNNVEVVLPDDFENLTPEERERVERMAREDPDANALDTMATQEQIDAAFAG